MTTQSHSSRITARHQREHYTGLPGKIRLIGIGLLLCATAHIAACSTANGGDRETTDGEALMREADGESATDTRAPAEGWRTCNVNRTGAGWGNVYIRLTCNGVPENWFIARSDQTKEMLATALTAITTSKQVRVFIEHRPSGYHEIKACYIIG